jgi:hypothetical protein
MSDPAFPTANLARKSQTHPLEFVLQGGLTKREYFAALALQGLIAHPKSVNSSFQQDAESAVYAADCLIKELAKDK